MTIIARSLNKIWSARIPVYEGEFNDVCPPKESNLNASEEGVEA